MRTVIGIVICLFLWPATAQIVFVNAAANAEYADLFGRAARSTAIVLGKVVEDKGVLKRDLPKLVQVGPDTYLADVTSAVAGRLATVEIGESICRGQDFTLLSLHEVGPTGSAHIFIPAPQMGISTGASTGASRTPEQIFKGSQYLLFLTPYPNQENLVENNRLEAGVTYYRAYGGYFGAIELPDESASQERKNARSHFVDVVRQFCEAVKPPGAAEKIARLRALREKADHRWIDSVDAAIRSLEEESKP